MQERVEVQRDVREQEGRSCLGVRGNALQQCQGVADPVGLVSCQHGRVDRWVDVDDFLEKDKKFFYKGDVP